MPRTQIVPESAAQLVDRWSAELDAMHAAGDNSGLATQSDAYARNAVDLLIRGSLAAAEEFARLAQKAGSLARTPAARPLIRHPHVTEELMERDA